MSSSSPEHPTVFLFDLANVAFSCFTRVKAPLAKPIDQLKEEIATNFRELLLRWRKSLEPHKAVVKVHGSFDNGSANTGSRGRKREKSRGKEKGRRGEKGEKVKRTIPQGTHRCWLSSSVSFSFFLPLSPLFLLLPSW
jgi:hypothetical protein